MYDRFLQQDNYYRLSGKISWGLTLSVFIGALKANINQWGDNHGKSCGIPHSSVIVRDLRLDKSTYLYLKPKLYR